MARAADYLTWVEIDRAALLGNLRAFRKLVAPADILPVVKSNAYGHGMRGVTTVLRREPRWGFGVATLEEALTLRSLGITGDILVLSSFRGAEVTQAIHRRIVLPLYDLSSATALEHGARAAGRTARVHLKIDIGTSRI